MSETSTVWKFVVWSVRLRRVEYRVAELPIYLIPVLLSNPDPGVFTGLVFWEGLCIFFFLFALGDLLNCLADRELDAIYKPHLTEAVYGLGVRGVLAQAVGSAAAAVALSAHLAWVLDRWWLVPAVVMGCVLAWGYSVEPVRLKRRGVWQLGFYVFGLFTGPMIFAAMLFNPWPDPAMCVVAVAFGLTQTGEILVNTAEDYPEDRQLEVRTVTVALGLPRGMGLAALLIAFGGVGLVAALGLRSYQEQSAIVWLGLAPLGLSVAASGISVTRLWLIVRGASEEDAIAAVKRAAKWVPLWITSVAVSSLVAAAVAYGQARGW